MWTKKTIILFHEDKTITTTIYTLEYKEFLPKTLEVWQSTKGKAEKYLLNDAFHLTIGEEKQLLKVPLYYHYSNNFWEPVRIKWFDTKVVEALLKAE